MKIKLTVVLLGMLLPAVLAAQVVPPPAGMPTPAAPQLGASSYLLMDFNSGKALVEHDADAHGRAQAPVAVGSLESHLHQHAPLALEPAPVGLDEERHGRVARRIEGLGRRARRGLEQ